jgi:hypothetical protein
MLLWVLLIVFLGSGVLYWGALVALLFRTERLRTIERWAHRRITILDVYPVRIWESFELIADYHRRVEPNTTVVRLIRICQVTIIVAPAAGLTAFVVQAVS